MAETFWLTNPIMRGKAHAAIDAAPDDHICKVYQADRNDAQNRKLHAMLADVRKQIPDMAEFSIDDMKLRFMNSLGWEMRWLPCLEGAGQFPVAQRTSKLSKAQFAGLITLIYAYANPRGVVWSDPRDQY